MNLLHTIGLMTRAEHERIVHRMSDKFKRAATDLEKQIELNAELHELADGRAAKVLALSSEIAALRPDALAMRRKRQMDRDRRKGR
jgi:hypothetical protein